MDRWRYGVFSGEYSQDKWMYHWLDLSEKYQGIVPPVKRSEKDFDPGAKYFFQLILFLKRIGSIKKNLSYQVPHRRRCRIQQVRFYYYFELDLIKTNFIFCCFVLSQKGTLWPMFYSSRSTNISASRPVSTSLAIHNSHCIGATSTKAKKPEQSFSNNPNLFFEIFAKCFLKI